MKKETKASILFGLTVATLVLVVVMGVCSIIGVIPSNVLWIVWSIIIGSLIGLVIAMLRLYDKYDDWN